MYYICFSKALGMTNFDIKEKEGRLLLKDILEQFEVKKIIFNPD